MPLLHNIPLYNSEGESQLVSLDVDYSDNGFKVIVNACNVLDVLQIIPSDEIVDIQTGIARALNYLDEDENPELWRVVVECEITNDIKDKPIGSHKHVANQREQLRVPLAPDEASRRGECIVDVHHSVVEIR
jgi:hypothetical protein